MEGLATKIQNHVGHISPWGKELVQRARTAHSLSDFQEAAMRRLRQFTFTEKDQRLLWECMEMALSEEIPLDQHHQPLLTPEFMDQIRFRYKEYSMHILGQSLQRLDLEFPFKRYFLNPDTMMSCLQKLDTSTRFQKKPFTLKAPPIVFRSFPLEEWYPMCDYIETNKDDYNTMDALADYFTEDVRLSAIPKGARASVLETWKHDPKVRYSAYTDAIFRFGDKGNVDVYCFREAFFTNKKNKECTQFKCTLSKCVYDMYAGDGGKVLDLSAGWGDRLIGALASSRVHAYHGYDPNPALVDGHNAILSRFNASAQKQAWIKCIPVEQVDHLDNGPYDLVFTSTPFYNVEQYTNAPGQSIQGKSSLNAWLNDFLFLALSNAWAALKVGGHLILHLNDGYGLEMCEPTFLYCVGYLQDCAFVKVLGTQGSDSGVVRPMWVFQKKKLILKEDHESPLSTESPVQHKQKRRKPNTTTIKDIPPEQAQRWLKNNYSKLWIRMNRVYLVPLNFSHAMAIGPLLQNPSVMQWVGNGKPWGQDKITKLFQHVQTSGNNGAHKHWAVMHRELGCVGFIRIRPVDYIQDTTPRITVVIAPQFHGNGLGTQAVRQLLSDYKQPLRAEVSMKNSASTQMLLKAGFQPTQNVNIHGHAYLSFMANEPASPNPS